MKSELKFTKFHLNHFPDFNIPLKFDHEKTKKDKKIKAMIYKITIKHVRTQEIEKNSFNKKSKNENTLQKDINHIMNE